MSLSHYPMCSVAVPVNTRVTVVTYRAYWWVNIDILTDCSEVTEVSAVSHLIAPFTNVNIDDAVRAKIGNKTDVWFYDFLCYSEPTVSNEVTRSQAVNDQWLIHRCWSFRLLWLVNISATTEKIPEKKHVILSRFSLGTGIHLRNYTASHTSKQSR